MLKGSVRRRYTIALIAGAFISFLLAKLASHLYFDPRPFTKPGVTAFFYHSNDNGFPSDHTTYGALLSFVVYRYSKRIGLIMIPIAIAIGAARVFAQVHSWIDIIAAVGIAFIAAATAEFIVRKRLPTTSRAQSQPTNQLGE